jgi:FMN phosphatase YigB (HAD superfamily)
MDLRVMPAPPAGERSTAPRSDRPARRRASPTRGEGGAGGIHLHGFDAFDTLVTRCWWRPEDVFLEAGERLRGMGLVRESAEAWAARRAAAEAALRRVPGTEEVDLKGIYAALAADLGWSAAEKEAAAEIELSCEEAAIRPIAENIGRLARLQAEGAEVAVLSDTYFDGASLLRLLDRGGVSVRPDRVFGSSALMASKRTGRMFGAVAQTLGVPPAAIAFTGNHPDADFAVPRAAGLQAELYTAGEPTRYETLLHAATAAHPAAVGSTVAGASRAARLSRVMSTAHERALWTVGTGVAGPLLCGFTLWVLQQARLRGVQRLHFVSRDGQILKRIADMFCDRLGWQVDCRYLLGSRQAWHLPTVESLDETALAWMVEEGVQDPLRAVLARAELAPSDVSAALGRHGLGDPSALASPAPPSQVADVLRNPEVESLVLAAAAKRRQAALGYLEQAGLLEPVPQAMVDLGWHGRLQRSLRRLLEIGAGEDRTPDLTGFYFALVSRPPGFAPDAMRAYVEAAPVVERLNPVLFEIFCAADHGTVRRYRPAPDGGFAAELASATNEPVLSWGLSTLQDGILAFACELADCMVRMPWHGAEAWSDALRDAGTASFELFHLDPSEEEAEAFGSFPHADGQTHAVRGDCAPPVGALSRLRLGLGFKDASYGGHWPEASVRRNGGRLGEGLAALRRLKRRLAR